MPQSTCPNCAATSLRPYQHEFTREVDLSRAECLLCGEAFVLDEEGHPLPNDANGDPIRPDGPA